MRYPIVLPNWVAALTLLKLGGTPYLIHTTYTQIQAERLALTLSEFPHLKPAQFASLGNFSCTTTESRSLCKQKLIEANFRARQLGGAEGRVALVCCNQYPDSLRSELEVSIRNRKIAVFGRSDLPNLGQKIINWVKQNG